MAYDFNYFYRKRGHHENQKNDVKAACGYRPTIGE